MNYTWENEELTLDEFKILVLRCDEETFRSAVQDSDRVSGGFGKMMDTSQELPTAVLTFNYYAIKRKFVLQLREDGNVWLAAPIWTDEEAEASLVFQDHLFRAFRGDYDFYRMLGIEKPE